MPGGFLTKGHFGGPYPDIGAAKFTVGTESGNAINVAIQFTDIDGTDVAERRAVFAYLSGDANGDDIIATAPSGGFAIGTDGLAIEVIADKAAWLVSEADGDIDITITTTTTPTYYLVLVMPDGRLVVSPAITFA